MIFFFQAEDGIRDGHVTGVQTCALPILAVVTSLTAQNTMGVQDVYNVPADFIEKEMHSVFSDEVPNAMKTGMIAEADMMKVIEKYIKDYKMLYVMDPVMIATSGDRLMTDRKSGV